MFDFGQFANNFIFDHFRIQIVFVSDIFLLPPPSLKLLIYFFYLPSFTWIGENFWHVGRLYKFFFKKILIRTNRFGTTFEKQGHVLKKYFFKYFWTFLSAFFASIRMNGCQVARLQCDEIWLLTLPKSIIFYGPKIWLIIGHLQNYFKAGRSRLWLVNWSKGTTVWKIECFHCMTFPLTKNCHFNQVILPQAEVLIAY